ncbi:hypothetical protein U0070_006542, partial [Myodes glareolus]
KSKADHAPVHHLLKVELLKQHQFLEEMSFRNHQFDFCFTLEVTVANISHFSNDVEKKGDKINPMVQMQFRQDVCVYEASRRAMLGQSVRRFTTSVVRRSHYEEGPGKNLPFSVENKWRLLAMMTVYFGSGFAAPFFIVRHQLLKK